MPQLKGAEPQTKDINFLSGICVFLDFAPFAVGFLFIFCGGGGCISHVSQQPRSYRCLVEFHQRLEAIGLDFGSGEAWRLWEPLAGFCEAAKAILDQDMPDLAGSCGKDSICLGSGFKQFKDAQRANRKQVGDLPPGEPFFAGSPSFVL